MCVLLFESKKLLNSKISLLPWPGRSESVGASSRHTEAERPTPDQGTYRNRLVSA